MDVKKIIVGEDGGAGEFWIAEVLSYRDIETRFVFCLGGSVSFISALLQAGFRVIVLDRDSLVLLGIKRYLEEEGPGAHEANLHFLCVDIEQGIGSIPHQADAFLIIRCLHHMSNIASALHMLAGYMSNGALLVILDTTKELLEQEISDRQWRYDNYKDSAHEAHDYLCLQGCVASGLYDETSARTLVNENGLANISDFHYPIACPCGNWGCGSVMSYWLGVWNIGA